MGDVFEARTRRLQDRLADHEGDAVVCTASPNLYYLSGFFEHQSDRHLLCVVPESGDPSIVAPALYETQLAEESWIADVRTYGDDGDPLARVATAARDLDVADGHLLLDPTMYARFTIDLRETLAGATFGLAGDVMTALRITKDEAELEAIRAASAVADAVIEEVRELGSDVLGRTETAVARTIERSLADHGGEKPAFEVIVGSGPNGAKPHHTHGDRTIERGDPVVLDFGTRVDHYPSDQTRTVVFGGDPPDGFEEAFRAVRDAQTAAVDAIEPGVAAATVDRAARSVLEDRGYGEAFVHRTGHGVGLDVHEAPEIVGGNDRTLRPGMVTSVEPGVYVPGEFGVRIEDLVVVTADGATRLNHTHRGYEPTAEG
ncbi:MAG: M24 family metallopeptidase [Halanaeroarchaeum sp.]